MDRKITIPPFLKKGDTIGLICPAGAMAVEKTLICQNTLQQWGYKIRVGQTVGERDIYFSGTDNERLEDMQQMLDNPEIKAILCARGGYGTSRIVDDISWKKFRKKPKWIIGYSDITVLHSFLYTRMKTASLHAPMAAAFNNGGDTSRWTRSLKDALRGKPIQYKHAGSPLNKTGTANGVLLGGNLSLLVHQIGTPGDLNTKNVILFIEDVGEYLYNIDRMLLHMDRAGKLKDLAGLIIGGFTENKDTDKPFGQTAEEIIQHRLRKYDFPVCFDFPVSHDEPNLAMKVGVVHELKVGRNVTLKEI